MPFSKLLKNFWQFKFGGGVPYNETDQGFTAHILIGKAPLTLRMFVKRLWDILLMIQFLFVAIS